MSQRGKRANFNLGEASLEVSNNVAQATISELQPRPASTIQRFNGSTIHVLRRSEAKAERFNPSTL
jgi:hypothetical protein